MTKSQPHRCYLILSVVLIIIILLSPFNTFTSNDGKVITLSYSPEWSYWPYNLMLLIKLFRIGPVTGPRYAVPRGLGPIQHTLDL